MIRTILMALLTGAMLGVASAQEPDERAAETSDYAAMAEDIEVMQRILGKVLVERFARSQSRSEIEPVELAPEVAAALDSLRAPKVAAWLDAFVPGVADALDAVPANPRTGSTLRFYTEIARDYASVKSLSRPSAFDVEGFYVPGSGVIYTMSFPVNVQPTGQDKDGATKGDTWGKMELEVRDNGRMLTGTWSPDLRNLPDRYEIEREDLDRTVDLLLKTIGDYGLKIEQLKPDESIILVARVDRMARVTKVVGSSLQFEFAMATGKTPRLRLVINVPVGAIKALSSGEIDWETFKRRAVITELQVRARKGTAKISWRQD